MAERWDLSSHRGDRGHFQRGGGSEGAEVEMNRVWGCSEEQMYLRDKHVREVTEECLIKNKPKYLGQMSCSEVARGFLGEPPLRIAKAGLDWLPWRKECHAVTHRRL